VKNTIKYTLQKILGLKRYLYWFARYKIRTIKSDSRESGFFVFIDLVKNPGVLLDIGANLGVMSYHYSSAFPDRKVHAFEPIPLNISIFKRVKNRYKLDNVILHEIALGAENSQIDMVLPEKNNVVLHGLAHVVHESIRDFNDGRKMTVDCYALDSWIEAKRIDTVAAIKLDVENFESFVLIGGRKTIEKDQPLIYSELWDNENRRECIALLETMNYQTCAIVSGKVVNYDQEKHQTQNFIFVPQDNS